MYQTAAMVKSARHFEHTRRLYSGSEIWATKGDPRVVSKGVVCKKELVLEMRPQAKYQFFYKFFLSLLWFDNSSFAF